MPGEFLNLCSCRLVNLRREGDEIIAEIRCPVQSEPGEAEGEGLEKRAKAPVTRILRQVVSALPGEILAQKGSATLGTETSERSP